MEKYIFKNIRIISNSLDIDSYTFIISMDEWYSLIEDKLIIFRSKENVNTEIQKLLNIQLNILSEIDIFLSNQKLNYRIEII